MLAKYFLERLLLINRLILFQELEAAGVLHKKILMPGRIIPPNGKVKQYVPTSLYLHTISCLPIRDTHGLYAVFSAQTK